MHFLESTDKENAAFKNLISNFIIPFDIKNDIVYCQKSFRIYLKVHKMVLTIYGDRIPTIPKVKKLMADLEREIYQINAEQKFLIIRLRRCLEEFYNSFNQFDIKIDRDYATTYINQMFKDSVDNLINDCTILPIKVKKRRSFEQWILKFGLNINDNENQSTVTPSLLLSNQLTISAQQTPPQLALHSKEIQEILERIEPQQTLSKQQQFSISNPFYNIPESVILKQESLLKPKCERSFGNENDNFNENSNIKIESSNECKQNNENIVQIENNIKPIVQGPPKVSMSINTGRMNLLQALNKAKCQNQFMSGSTSGTTTITNTNQKHKLLKFKKLPLIVSGSKKGTTKDDFYQNSKPSTSKIKCKSADNSVPQSSASSDDSLDGIKNYPQFEKELPEPTDYNQEMFLRLFGLNTIPHSIYLQQRRSKRRRRNVQSNERKDFHYGNLDITAQQMAEKEKKKKIFLASPTANRNMKRKQIDKNKYKGRSSSSPEQKVVCNQCSKNGDIGLSHCQTCRGYFHAKCHQGSFLRKSLQIREKICPSCYKAQKSRSTSTDDQQSRNSNNTSPNSQVSLIKELHGKLNTARSRKNSLLKESDIFKTKMNELFTIVNTIKKEDSDDNNDNNNKEIELTSITDQLKCKEQFIDELKCNELISNDDNDNIKSSNNNNKLYSADDEQNKFDEIMMLIHDNQDNIRKISNYDKSNDNLYEIYDSDDNSNQNYNDDDNKNDNNDDDEDDDVIMIIDESVDNDGNESIYEIQENSHDSTDREMLAE